MDALAVASSNSTLWPLLAGGGVVIIGSLVGALLGRFTSLTRLTIGPLKVAIDREEQEIRERLPPTTAPEEDRQYALLREYHAQGLAQSKISFWFSVLFAVLGFIVIVVGLFLAEPGASVSKQGATAFTLVAGAIVEAVSGLFFVQSNRAQQLMAAFFDRLRTDRKLEEALTLVEKMSDQGVKSRTQALLALHFAGLEAKVDRLALVLGTEARPDPEV